MNELPEGYYKSADGRLWEVARNPECGRLFVFELRDISIKASTRGRSITPYHTEQPPLLLTDFTCQTLEPLELPGAPVDDLKKAIEAWRK